MLDEYRQRFRAFHAQYQREQYLCRSGRKAQAEIDFLYRENSDLFTLEANTALHAQQASIDAYRETERAALNRLLAFAAWGHLSLKTRTVEAELAAYEARAAIAWGEQRLSLRQVQRQLAQITDPARRRELYARYAAALDGAQDLQSERMARLHAAVQALGYDNLPQMQGALYQIDLEKLAAPSARLLAQTERAYVAALTPLLAREAQVSLDQASPADLGALHQLASYAPLFPPEQQHEVYAALCTGLGFDASKQSNVALENSPNLSRAFCAPLQIPDEIKLVSPSNAAPGVVFYQSFLRATAQTQLFAWTSREARYEFRVPGDPALAAAWDALFESLLGEAEFLVGHFGFTNSSEFQRALAVLRLLRARRAAALLQYEMELHNGQLHHQAGVRFAELLTEGVRVHYDATERWRAIAEPLRCAASLRGWAFAAQLREHLQMRFGTRWWASRRAGEMLIDLWNTGHRYAVEQLAAQIGLGALDFDWLGTKLLEPLAN